jgi:hypothetical protein
LISRCFLAAFADRATLDGLGRGQPIDANDPDALTVIYCFTIAAFAFLRIAMKTRFASPKSTVMTGAYLETARRRLS